jgi:hypothetical protein
MGTVIEPPHPRDPVGTVGREIRDPLPTPPLPSPDPRAPLASSVATLRTRPCSLPDSGFTPQIP